MKVTIVLLLFIHSSLGGYTKSYSNYTLFRTLPLTEEHLEFMKNLSTYMRVDYWRPPGVLNKPVEFLINPDDKKMFIRSMDEKQFYYTTIIDDVQKAFDLQTIKPYIRRRMDTFDWRSYFNLKDIYSWIKDLEKSYPNEVTILHLGRTYEDREILGVKVILRGSKRRSAVVIESGIHAREWIAPAFTTYFLDKLVKSVNKTGSDIEKIAKTYEFYFIPVLNPDGYEFSINTDRMWRKNRNGGYGVDINRNFDAGFGTTGVSSIKLEEIYCGPYAFSEKESQAVQKMTQSIRDKLEYYLAFHSYGQYMIIPYAHLKEHKENYDEMYKILKEARSKMSRRYNTKYTIGTAFETVGYTTSGVSGCWAKKEYKIPYVATFELRDLGMHGFALPYHLILPTCRESMDGLLEVLTPKTKQFKKLNDTGLTYYMSSKKEVNVYNVYVAIFELRDSGNQGFTLPPDQIIPTCAGTLDGVKTLLRPRTKRLEQLSFDIENILKDDVRNDSAPLLMICDRRVIRQ